MPKAIPHVAGHGNYYRKVNNDELRGAVNAGHKRGGQMIRCVGDDAEPRRFSVFAPAAIAAIGRLGRLATIEDRSLVVRMKRATRAERPAPLDAKAEAEGTVLARKCARFAADHEAALAAAEPTLPPALFNRVADNWRPLFAVAEAAGGGWPDRLTKASAALLPDDDAEGRGVRLLADIRAIFAERPKGNRDKIATEDLLAALIALDTSPWADMNHGRPITSANLARLLRPFEVRPGSKREGKDTFKGYERGAFAEPWRRYLDDPKEEGGSEPSHRHNPQKTAKNGAWQPSQGFDGVTAPEPQKPQNSAECDGVTAQGANPGPDGHDDADEVVL
jgi:hypothetical protein